MSNLELITLALKLYQVSILSAQLIESNGTRMTDTCATANISTPTSFPFFQKLAQVYINEILFSSNFQIMYHDSCCETLHKTFFNCIKLRKFFSLNRLLVLIRVVVLALFLTWRIQNPNRDAMWLWGMSIVCECWFAFSWLLDILPKINPINRATDLAALHDKFEQSSPSNPHGRSDLPGIDIFVSTADPDKEPPLVTANTILSILAVDYPVEKLSCYISDDGGAILTFEAMAEAVQFAEVLLLSSSNVLPFFELKTIYSNII